MSIPPERYFQKDDGMSIKRVETFRMMVNSVIESASESVMIYGYHFPRSPTDPARMTGRTGSTQGASIVSAHARNDKSASEVMREK